MRSVIECRQRARGQRLLDAALNRLMVDAKAAAHRIERRPLAVGEQHPCSLNQARRLAARARKLCQTLNLLSTHRKLDRSPPPGHLMAATAQAQAEATKEAQRAGIEHAKASGERYKGRKPSFSRSQFETVRDMLGQDAGVSTIAKVTGLTRQTIYRIKDDAAGSQAALATWGQ